jgi:ADP-heptose:LPS heptosyltransferase
MSGSMNGHPMRVVVPIVAGIGNALLAVPMIRAMKRSLPAGSFVTIIARTDAMAEPFRRLDEVEEVLVSGLGARGILRSILWTRKRRPHYYLLPFPSNRWQYSMLALVSGAKKRVLHGYLIGYWRTLGFVGTRVPAIRGLHDVEQNLRLLSGLGICLPPIEAPEFRIREDDRCRADRLLSAAGIEPATKFVAIHAGSAATILSRAKRWSTAKYAELIERIIREFDLSIVLLEGPDEAGVAAEIVAHHRTRTESTRMAIRGLFTVKLTGSLGDAAAILHRAELYIGTDSGLAHLAAAVGTRAVTLFAPADPNRVCPFGNRDLVVQPSVACAPCFMYPWQATHPKMRCCDPFCVDKIDVEQVLQKVQAALKPVLSPLPLGER